MPNNALAETAAKYLNEMMAQKDSCGGIIECRVTGLPVGLGEPVFDKLDAQLSKGIMSMGAVKAVEIGDGFLASLANGSTNNDAFTLESGHLTKKTNHSGGVLGGISDGSELIVRAAVKPTPSIARTQSTVNLDNEEIEISIKGRHDPIIVPRAVVVVESMTALTLADLLLCNMCSRLDSIKNFYQEEKDV